MAGALYRRYRPDTFGDLVGQDHVTETLRSALEGDRISHAYLFSGPRGCGKTTSARIMARCLNCANGPTSEPCGTCDSCIELASGGPGSLDVIEMDAASNRGIEDARDLRERVEFAPIRDRFKIVILDEAHMVTKEGANALLKLIEEPPPHVKFIFATTEPEKMLATIRSRTHHYQFRLVPPQTLIPYLEGICTSEGITPEPGVLELVVRAGGGSVRDSLSVLDQLLAGADGAVLPYARSAALLGFTDVTLLDDVVEALGNGDAGAVFTGIDRVTSSGVDPRRFTEDLLQRLRDLVICSLAPEQAAAILPHIPADQLKQMIDQSARWGSRLLSRRADVVEEALAQMVGATPPRLMLELLMGRLLSGADDASGSAGASPVPPAPSSAPVQAPPSPRPSQPEPVRVQQETTPPAPPAASPPPQRPQPPAPAPVASGGSLKWDKIVESASGLSAIAGAVLREAEPTVDGTTIYLSIRGPLASRVEANRSLITQAITTVMGPTWSLGEGAPNPKAPAPRAPAPVSTPSPESGRAAARVIHEEIPPAPEPEPDFYPAPEEPSAEGVEEEEEEDLPSFDDADGEKGIAPGVPMVLDILGGRIIEEKERKA